MGYNVKNKILQNIAALRAVLRWKNGYVLTQEECNSLLSFSGWGGMKAVMYGDTTKDYWLSMGASNADMAVYDQVQELYSMLRESIANVEDYKRVVESIKNATLSSFFTPKYIPEVLYSVLEQYKHPVKTILDPSAGSGIFLTTNSLPYSTQMLAYEKDLLTSMVLDCISKVVNADSKNKITVINAPFEASGLDVKHDLVTSNIPFGAYGVYDKYFPDNNIAGRIHNYFFAKGIMKCNEGGILAFLTTNAFLDSPMNKTARKFLFSQADFISVSVLPDDLMAETANTYAPTHFLVVQKNSNKTQLTLLEEMLCNVVTKDVDGTKVQINEYISRYEDVYVGRKYLGTNQYGKPIVACESIKVDGDTYSAELFQKILSEDFAARYSPIDIQVPVAEEQDTISEVTTEEEKPSNLIVVDINKMPKIPKLDTGSLVLLTVGQADLFTEQEELYKVVSVDMDHNTAIVEKETELKPGKERNVMIDYIKIRDAYYELIEIDK
jgi:hypothetical protein